MYVKRFKLKKAMSNYSVLMDKIKSAVLTTARMTGVKVGQEWALEPGSDNDHKFKTEKSADITLSDNAAASIRVCQDPTAAVKFGTTAEARESGVIVTLQKALTDEAVKELNEKTKFKCIHRVKIIDTITDQPVLNNECYNGYKDYLKAARKAARLTGDARRDAFAAASDALRSSGVINQADLNNTDKIQHMPVFQVVSN